MLSILLLNSKILSSILSLVAFSQTSNFTPETLCVVVFPLISKACIYISLIIPWQSHVFTAIYLSYIYLNIAAQNFVEARG